MPVDATLKTAFADDAAARGRLGGGARRRPVPRRAHPGVAARGAAPLGRGHGVPETAGTPALTAEQALRRGRRAGVVVARRAGPGRRDSSQSAGGHQRRGERPTPIDRGDGVAARPPASRPTAGPTCASTPAQSAGEHRRRRRRWPGRARPGGRRASARPAAPARAGAAAARRGPPPPGPPARRPAGPAACGRRAPRRRPARPAAPAATSAAAAGRRRRPARAARSRRRARAARTTRSRRADRASMQVLPADDGVDVRGRQRGDAGRPPGRDRAAPPPGSRVSHGTSTKARSCARGCGSVSAGSSESTGVAVVPGDRDDVDVERARAPAHLAGAPGGLLELVRRASQPAASAVAADDGDRVQVRRLLDRPPRRRLVEGRARDQAVVRQRGQRGAQRAGAVARGWRPATGRRGSWPRPADRHRDVVERHARGRRRACAR